MGDTALVHSRRPGALPEYFVFLSFLSMSVQTAESSIVDEVFQALAGVEMPHVPDADRRGAISLAVSSNVFRINGHIQKDAIALLVDTNYQILTTDLSDD